MQICGYRGPAVVVVSCVTAEAGETAPPPRTHPHNLVSPASVGRDGCKKGVCTMNVNNDEMSVEFPHLGIQVLHCSAGHEGPVADISCMSIFSACFGLLTSLVRSDLDFLLNSTSF